MNTVNISKLETRLFINNEFVNSVSGKKFETIDPATEEVICSVHEAGPEDVDKAVSFTRFLPHLKFNAAIQIMTQSVPRVFPRCRFYQKRSLPPKQPSKSVRPGVISTALTVAT